MRSDDPWLERLGLDGQSVGQGSWNEYLVDIERAAARAWRTYGLLVLPGLELTFNDDDPARAAHAVALGLREFVSVDDGIAEAMRTAAQAGAALVAAHPYSGEPVPASARLTQRFALDENLCGLAHRFELFNRNQLFGWVAKAALPALATGDFHRPEHLLGWKTLLPSRHDEQASSTLSARAGRCISRSSKPARRCRRPRGHRARATDQPMVKGESPW